MNTKFIISFLFSLFATTAMADDALDSLLKKYSAEPAPKKEAVSNDKAAAIGPQEFCRQLCTGAEG